MDFVANQEKQINEMLQAIGVESIDQLFTSIPKNLKCAPPSLNDGLSEYEGMRLMESIGERNTFSSFENYLGAGAYEHHVPVLSGVICQKSEFLTSYTPYQAEASQGLLQAIFEFQSALAALTGLEVANASVYDGGSACAEALLMAIRVQRKRPKLIISKNLNPFYRSVVDQYLLEGICQVVEVGQDIERHLDDQTAAVLVQSPNFYGVIEEVKGIADSAKKVGALTILCANPLSYGLLSSAAELGVDIAVGDCQPLGLPLQFGGPYVGYMACTAPLMRQLPGRLVGLTTDGKGRLGYTLTLQAREQHIRREKATSNICTNQALAAISSLVTILWYGKEGIQKLALTNYQRSQYLRAKLLEIPHFTPYSDSPTFNEFALRVSVPLDTLFKHFRNHQIEPGYPLSDNDLLIAVTETKNKEQLDRFIAVAKSFGGGA